MEFYYKGFKGQTKKVAVLKKISLISEQFTVFNYFTLYAFRIWFLQFAAADIFCAWSGVRCAVDKTRDPKQFLFRQMAVALSVDLHPLHCPMDAGLWRLVR